MSFIYKYSEYIKLIGIPVGSMVIAIFGCLLISHVSKLHPEEDFQKANPTLKEGTILSCDSTAFQNTELYYKNIGMYGVRSTTRVVDKEKLRIAIDLNNDGVFRENDDFYYESGTRLTKSEGRMKLLAEKGKKVVIFSANNTDTILAVEGENSKFNEVQKFSDVPLDSYIKKTDSFKNFEKVYADKYIKLR